MTDAYVREQHGTAGLEQDRGKRGPFSPQGAVHASFVTWFDHRAIPESARHRFSQSLPCETGLARNGSGTCFSLVTSAGMVPKGQLQLSIIF